MATACMIKLQQRAQMIDGLIARLESVIATAKVGGDGARLNVDGSAHPRYKQLIAENERLRAAVEKAKQQLVFNECLLNREQVFVSKLTALKNDEPKVYESVKVDELPTKKSSENSVSKQQNGGETKDKTKKKEAKPKVTKAPVEDIPVDISRLDLRVGKIVEISKHPDADTLYIEKVDVGRGEEVRTIVSGLANHVPMNEMLGNKFVFVCNLKPAKLKGVFSHGMIMCASREMDGAKTVEIIRPPTAAEVGTRVFVPGFHDRHGCPPPEAQLNPKKKVWESCAPDLQTNSKREACYKGVPWARDNDATARYIAPTLADSIIK